MEGLAITMVEFVHEETLEASFASVAAPKPPPKPELTALEVGDTYGKFAVSPLGRGYGITLGNPLRRVLLSSIPGTAVTWVKVDGVQHEYSTIPHVKEDATEILMNIAAIRLRSLTERPGKLRLEVSGEGRVCAGDIIATSEFEIVNPETHLATIDSPEGNLSMELNVEQGSGYVPASASKGLPIGVLPVDSIFSPVRKVNYDVEKIRVGQATDYERLILEVWTDGTITPADVVQRASSILVEHFFLFANVTSIADGRGETGGLARAIPAEQYNILLEKLELSARTLNCLKRAHINKVGEVMELTNAELLNIRNFGEKSLNEMYERLREQGIMLPKDALEQEDGIEQNLVEETTATE
jgi:DNA-directed RNA polymerase subunit alpha